MTGRSQWSSGSTLACGERGPRIEPAVRTSFRFSGKITAIAALGAD